MKLNFVTNTLSTLQCTPSDGGVGGRRSPSDGGVGGRRSPSDGGVGGR